ncbi:Hypothetical protein FKW44_019107 [Caligus rogercresseyi]|uniref:Uncharacterized protein n=1 Tax=Caligus rogercresseyi TaxID=217165 RepID=A0A7T8GVC9_CALRO|nr:Hypothetical protein FKW44_019107 [Caligus rogercresseyi]
MTSADSNTFLPPLNPLPEGLTKPVFRDGPPDPGPLLLDALVDDFHAIEHLLHDGK